MKKLILFSLIIVYIFSCQRVSENKGATPTPQISPYPNQSTSSSIDTSLDKNSMMDISGFLRLNFQPGNSSYVSDTIVLDSFKYIVYGNIDAPNLKSEYLYTYIDSVEVFQPVYSVLKLENPDDLGGYLYREDGYSFDEIILFKDANNDRRTDVFIFCAVCSGNSGYYVYNIFARHGSTFEHLYSKSYRTKTIQ